MEGISKFTIQNIKELEDIYNLIVNKITNEEKIIKFQLNDTIEIEILELLKHIFPSILFKKLENTTYIACWMKEHILEENNKPLSAEEYNKMVERVASIDYIV
jgi:hypothetical protein